MRRYFITFLSPWAIGSLGVLGAACAFLFIQLRVGNMSEDSPKNVSDESILMQVSKELAPVPSDKSFVLDGADNFSEVTDRPLFARSRRPLKGGDGNVGDKQNIREKNYPLAQIALSGVVLNGRQKIALLHIDNDAKMMHVGEGQMAGGWVVENIFPRRIVVRHDDTIKTLAMDRVQPSPVGGQENKSVIDSAVVSGAAGGTTEQQHVQQSEPLMDEEEPLQEGESTF